MGRPSRRYTVALALTAIALGLAAPSGAFAQVSPDAAAEARAQGFNAREALGPDVSLDQSGRNEGLFRVEVRDGRSLTTHGPDLIDAAAGEHGTQIGPGDPERAPVCATSDAQHVLYGVPADKASRYPTVVPQLQAIVRRMNAVLNSESLESGDRGADYRVRCNESGEIKVDTFTGPAGDDSFGAIVEAAEAAGFDDPDTKYTIFYDTDAPYCGVGSLYEDERLSASNYNNSGTAYGVTHDGCWNGSTPMHENGHNMGAVQPAAPNSTGSGAHCNQEHDVMCYTPDGGDRNQGPTVLDCADHLHFDCGHDDYFDPAPEPGEYLATNWNIGSPHNRFLAFGGTVPNRPPVANFAFVCSGLTCSFGDRSTDFDGTIATRAWSFGDGGTSTATGPSHRFPHAGTFEVSLTVTDSSGATATTTRPVTVNAPPVAVNDAATVEKSVARDLFVLANDGDSDGDPLKVTAVSGPAHGTAAVGSGGQSVRYAPAAGWVGRDSLTYTVSDGRGGQATATVAITVRDTIAPKVAKVSPASGTNAVSPGANVTARFSEPVKPATVSTTTVRLLRKGTTTPVRAVVRYSADTRIAVLDPASSLARGATYSATVTRGVRDLSANNLASAKSWSFTVRR